MQDLKKSKRKMNANQMTNPFLSNEEAIDKDTCDDLSRGCNKPNNNCPKPCPKECEQHNPCKPCNSHSHDHDCHHDCHNHKCEPCQIETGMDCVKNPCSNDECCSPLNLSRFNTANAVPFAIETNRVFDTMQFQIFQDASASDGSQLYFIYDVESVNGNIPTGGFVSVKIDEVCFDFSEIEITPGNVTLEGFTVHPVEPEETLCESTFESFVCGERNAFCCAQGRGTPSKFRERGLQVEVSDLVLTLRGHCGCTQITISAIPAFMDSQGNLVQCNCVGFRFNTLAAPICIPSSGMGITLRQNYQTKLSVSCVSNANVQKNCVEGNANYTVNIPGGIDLILCVQETVSILRGEQIVVLGSSTPITPRVVDTFSRVCDFTSCGDKAMSSNQNNNSHSGCGCNR